MLSHESLWSMGLDVTKNTPQNQVPNMCVKLRGRLQLRVYCNQSKSNQKIPHMKESCQYVIDFQAYGPHPLLRAASPYHPQQQQGQPQGGPMGVQPPSASMSSTGGYTLPPTAAYFPMTTYTSIQQHDNMQQVMMSQDSLNNVVQPNTPDLLMHRRQVYSHY